jgi:transposase
MARPSSPSSTRNRGRSRQDNADLSHCIGPVRPRGPASVLENRRSKAFGLLDQGFSLREVARRVKSAPSSVMRWRDARRRLGPEAVNVRYATGRRRKISANQARDLIRLLTMGSVACGCASEAWSTSRVADLIRWRFHIEYHPDHVGRLLRGFGWIYRRRGEPSPDRRETTGETQRAVRWFPHVETGWVPGPSSGTSWPFRRSG